jgi:hypothetical protein
MPSIRVPSRIGLGDAFTPCRICEPIGRSLHGDCKRGARAPAGMRRSVRKASRCICAPGAYICASLSPFTPCGASTADVCADTAEFFTRRTGRERHNWRITTQQGSVRCRGPLLGWARRLRRLARLEPGVEQQCRRREFRKRQRFENPRDPRGTPGRSSNADGPELDREHGKSWDCNWHWHQCWYGFTRRGLGTSDRGRRHLGWAESNVRACERRCQMFWQQPARRFDRPIFL